MFSSELWNKPASAGGTGFYTHQISQSVRLGDSGYLKRTPSSAGNRQTWTFSTWIKLSVLGINTNSTEPGGILNAGASGSQSGFYRLNYSVTKLFSSSAEANFFFSTGVYRDTSAWQHIVWTQGSGTATVYVNGVAAPGATASVSGDTAINNSVQHVIGGASNTLGETPLKAYLAETIMIDGTALGPDSFGETVNGVWIPKDASGLTFGTNGFHLDYADASALGNDVSGNNNDWTPVNIDTHDQMLDSPTFNSSSNGGNFMTYNGAYIGANNALAEGNLKSTGSSAGNNSGTFGMLTGKWYWECRAETVNSYAPTFGIGQSGAGNTDGQYYIITWQTAAGQMYGGGGYPDGMGTITVTSTGVTSLSSGDILSFWLDCDNRKLWIGKNGTIPNSGNVATGANPQASWATTPTARYFTATCQNVGSGVGVLNAGQNPSFNGALTGSDVGDNTDKNGYGLFKYDPSGTDFVACCAANIPTADAVDPAQTDDNYPQELFFMSDYNGNLTGRTITTENQPDLLMLRHWTTGQNWYTLDSNRVITDNKYILTNSTGAEATLPQANITSVGATSVGISSGTWLNSTGATYQMWMWRANGGTTSTNSAGSINTTQQVDPSGGFSISTYSGTAGTPTIGHGLSSAPTYVIVKQTNGTHNWAVYAAGAGATKYGFLESTSGFGTDNMWGNTSPTDTLVYLGAYTQTHGSGRNYVAYCFADTEGFIKSGSYEGNGNADGTFVYTGFRPAFIMTKSIDSSSDWFVFDDLRAGYNVDNNAITMNEAAAQTTTDMIDILSNGFKLRIATDPNVAETYVYLAFAENSFKYATAR